MIRGRLEKQVILQRYRDTYIPIQTYLLARTSVIWKLQRHITEKRRAIQIRPNSICILSRRL